MEPRSSKKIPSTRNRKKTMPSHRIIKLLKFSEEKILKATSGGKNITDKESKNNRLLDRNDASQKIVEEHH